jgi:hypothetical protein
LNFTFTFSKIISIGGFGGNLNLRSGISTMFNSGDIRLMTPTSGRVGKSGLVRIKTGESLKGDSGAIEIVTGGATSGGSKDLSKG